MFDLTGTVVAVIDDSDRAGDAVADLTAAGFAVTSFQGESGRARFGDDSDEGVLASLRRLVLAFGDETRVLDTLDQALAGGSTVVSVRVEEDQAQNVADVLLRHGGRHAWRLGEWSFNRVGDAGPEGDPRGGAG